MKKIFILTLIALTLFSCQPSSDSADLQKEFLKTKISSTHKKLVSKVEETGYSPAGEKFIEISEALTKQTQKIIDRVEKEQAVKSSDLSALLQLSENKYEQVPVDSVFLFESFRQFENDADKNTFTLSLLLFNSDAAGKMKMTFENFFNDIEYLEPEVLAKNFTIKKGEVFEAKAINQAKMAGIKFLYAIDDPQTPEGFTELPANGSSDYDGILKIEGRTPGTHTIKLRSTHWHNGEQRTYENEFELTVE